MSSELPVFITITLGYCKLVTYKPSNPKYRYQMYRYQEYRYQKYRYQKYRYPNDRYHKHLEIDLYSK